MNCTYKTQYTVGSRKKIQDELFEEEITEATKEKNARAVLSVTSVRSVWSLPTVSLTAPPYSCKGLPPKFCRSSLYGPHRNHFERKYPWLGCRS